MFVLFTDFGLNAPYVGQMKLILQSCMCQWPVVDLFHDAPGFDVQKAAYLLPRYVEFVPQGAVVIAVVDPGVGTERGFLRVSSRGRTYFGPDNGLFEMLIRSDDAARASLLDWDEPIASHSFHGRDVFSRMAVRHAEGALALPESPLQAHRFPEWPDDLLEVVYVDDYGNLISGLRSSESPKDSVFDLAGQRVGYARTFGDVESGSLFWYDNANGLVEFAVNQGSALQQTGAGLGSAFRVV